MLPWPYEVIDATEFEAPDHRRYMLWKTDTNGPGKTWIFGQELGPDGISFVGAPVPLLRNDQSWEGELIEAPWMLFHDGSYYLFFSANYFGEPNYTVGVARADSPLGDFNATAPKPILGLAGSSQPSGESTPHAWAASGHCSVLEASDSETYIVYHAYPSGSVGPPACRIMLVDRIVWQNGWPTVPGDPTTRRAAP